MEGEKDASLMPFVKQSKMVSRNPPEAVVPNSDYSNSDFWDWLSQQPSSCWMEEYHEAPVLLTSGQVVQRPGGGMEAAGSLPWPAVIPTLQKLPSPKELCGRKKKGPKRKGLENVRALSVLYHLEELKRRQSSIDELKKATLGGCIPQTCSGKYAADPLSKGPPSPLFKPMAAHLYEEHSFVDRHCNAQLLYPQWDPSAREQRSPMVSYTLATQNREPMAAAAACQPDLEEEEEEEEEGDFWGFELRSEE
ncbi:hypothetical protein JD844_000728 [Phrynosoma platyrhinos]|uniref:Protein INCA1 n=1 Tax=Phrynosoma platyrhinos TaxID=52577 RepID=A0ABQ7T936_PHRPL|nr:hypothetical protein JD844_000728 [Phrynosoma platyrhinos]